MQLAVEGRGIAQLTPEFQAAMIALAVVDSDYGAFLLRAFSEDVPLDKAYAVTWNVMTSFFREYTEFPSLVSLEQIAANLPNPEDSIFLKTALGRVRNADSKDFKYVREATRGFIQQRVISRAVVEQAERIEAGHPEEAYEVLRQAIMRCHVDEDLGHFYFEQAAERTGEDAKIRTGAVSTGLALDKHMRFGVPSGDSGGLCAGEMAVVLGGSGRGKSMFLVNIAANATIAGHDVLYVTLELNRETVARRFDMRFTMNEEHQEFMPDQVAEYLKIMRTAIKSRLVIKYMPARRATLVDLRAYLEQISLAHEFRPTLVVLDALYHMRASREHKDKRYMELEEMAEEVRAMGAERNFALWTAHQVKRGARNKERLQDEDIAEAHALFHPVDLMGGLAGTPKEMKNNIMRFTILKNRNGIDEISLPLRIHFERCSMVDGELSDIMTTSTDASEFLGKDR